ncbi:MAG TPA: hypothetical protein VNW73_16855, partial [Ktedonobacteraceae bacterium]|nr:hypothetical protein [Ktedonobacteraceae bacterium]
TSLDANHAITRSSLDQEWQGESARSPDTQATDANGESQGMSAHQAIAMENMVGASSTDPHIPCPVKGGRTASPASDALVLRKSSPTNFFQRSSRYGR